MSKDKSMTYFGLTETETYLLDEQYMTRARAYWGASPLPKGATLLGGFSDSRRAGALIKLSSGHLVCGNAGTISNVPQRAL